MELFDALDARVTDFLTPMSPRELRAALADLRVAQRDAPAETLGALFGMIGSVCFLLRDFHAALDAYRNAARYEKLSAEYPCNAAICLVELNRFREALDCLREARTRPHHGPGVEVSILVNTADARHHLGEHAAARSAFEEALTRLDPNSPRDLFNLADTAATLGAEDDAVELFARCLSIATGVEARETAAIDFIRACPDHFKAVLADHPTLGSAFATVGARHDGSIPEEHQLHAQIALDPAALTSLFNLLDHPPEPTEELRSLLNAPRS
jgi:tetratricopeptide (TPR) repeat protein